MSSSSGGEGTSLACTQLQILVEGWYVPILKSTDTAHGCVFIPGQANIEIKISVSITCCLIWYKRAFLDTQSKSGGDTIAAWATEWWSGCSLDRRCGVSRALGRKDGVSTGPDPTSKDGMEGVGKREGTGREVTSAYRLSNRLAPPPAPLITVGAHGHGRVQRF